MMLSSCSNEDNTDTPPMDEVESQLQRMTLREKVGQMFYVRPECLDTTIHFNRSAYIENQLGFSKEEQQQLRAKYLTN